jgi:hypothetical protein
LTFADPWDLTSLDLGGALFMDGFDSGTTDRWSATQP